MAVRRDLTHLLRCLVLDGAGDVVRCDSCVDAGALEGATDFFAGIHRGRADIDDGLVATIDLALVNAGGTAAGGKNEQENGGKLKHHVSYAQRAPRA
ncbi:MAG: hypothetical protein AAGA48_36690 [Myxococcota bacterium]